jgi:hypothetical protein
MVVAVVIFIFAAHEEAVDDGIGWQRIGDESAGTRAARAVGNPAMELDPPATHRDDVERARAQLNVGVECALRIVHQFGHRPPCDGLPTADRSRGHRAGEFAQEKARGSANGETGNNHSDRERRPVSVGRAAASYSDTCHGDNLQW